jgi:rhodanese-related sulfurtransferase
MKNVKYINSQQLDEICLQPDSILLDIREPNEFSPLHILSAVNTPLSSWDINNINKMCANKKNVILYCKSGQRTRMNENLFQQIQADEIMILEGGILAWEHYKAI